MATLAERKQALVDECAALLAARVRRMFVATLLADRYSLRELEELRPKLAARQPEEVKA